jgi:hypothetical protein
VRRDSGALWAITSYFNPAGYTRRIANYRVFRAHLAVPLVAVELSFDGHFELQRQDADVLVQIRGDSVLWQKERLLNIGLTHLPRACRYVAWIDCDVIFDRDEWAVRAIDALETFNLVHLFHERHDLPPDAGPGPDGLRSWHRSPTALSVVHKIATGEGAPEDLFLANAPLERRSTAGLAWASPRAVLDKHGLYDACILGSGDRVILCAALGQFSYGARSTLMNNRQAEHYLQWARPYYKTVPGRVGYIEGRLFHLWHGGQEDRRYGERHRGLAAYEFDPFIDIMVDPNGCWQWNSGKKELHAFVTRYFTTRNEDGRLTPASSPCARR